MTFTGRTSLLLCLLASVAACGGGGDPSPAGEVSCRSLGGGGARVEASVAPGCLDCAVTHPEAAADADFASAARVRVQSGIPPEAVGAADAVGRGDAPVGVSLRASAQSGIVHPAGHLAGAVLAIPSARLTTWSVSVRTFLQGALQEEGSNSSGGICGICGNRAARFQGMRTAKPFDAVEIEIVQSGAAPVEFEVFEICSADANGL